MSPSHTDKILINQCVEAIESRDGKILVWVSTRKRGKSLRFAGNYGPNSIEIISYRKKRGLNLAVFDAVKVLKYLTRNNKVS